MKEALFEVLYVSCFVIGFALIVRQKHIEESQKRRQQERKRQFANHENEQQRKLTRQLWALEDKKANRQSITIKGVLAEKILCM